MDRELFIDGGWHKAAAGARLEIKDPATGEHVGSTALAAAADVDRAVMAAQRAQPSWADAHADERCHIMLRAADLIEKRTGAIAMMLTREQGKPVPIRSRKLVSVCAYCATTQRKVGVSKAAYGRVRRLMCAALCKALRSAWLVRSFHGTIRSISTAGKSARRSRQAARWW